MDDITLTEHSTVTLASDGLSRDEAATLRQRYDMYVDVLRTWADAKWRLEAGGYVGVLPLTDQRALHLQPKGPVANVFRMLEVVGDLPVVPENMAETETLPESIDPLIQLLARHVNKRAQQGLYRKHVQQNREVQYIRGRIDVDAHLRAPHQPHVPCRFDEHKTDIEDNQILAWTLHRIARSGLGSDETRQQVREAFRRLSGRVRLVPVQPEDCDGRTYNRLNEDYRSLHAICRFLLAHLTPGHRPGTHSTVPFVVDMPALFERFVGSVFRTHISEENILDGTDSRTTDLARFDPDYVLKDQFSGTPRLILDAKYKYGSGPTSADVQQVVAYAAAFGCSEVCLVYPDSSIAGQEATIGDVRVRTAAVPLTTALPDSFPVVGADFSGLERD